MMNGVTQAAHKDKFASRASQVGKWVDKVLGPGFNKYSPAESWAPAINLYEHETHYCVVVDLAGVKHEEINLLTEGSRLTLSGYRQTPGVPELTESAQLHHMEIDHGQFYRSLELPRDVDSDRIEASYKCGFLWIHIPKK